MAITESEVPPEIIGQSSISSSMEERTLLSTIIGEASTKTAAGTLRQASIRREPVGRHRRNFASDGQQDHHADQPRVGVRQSWRSKERSRTSAVPVLDVSST